MPPEIHALDMSEEIAKRRMDAWVNALTGVGGTRDRTTAAVFRPNDLLDDITLEGMYVHSDLAAQIVDAVPHDAFRQGIIYKGDDGTVADKADELEAIEAQRDAFTWARLYGVGAVFIGTNDPDLMAPLIDENMTPGGVLYLDVLDKREMLIHAVETDPTSPMFGKPTHYQINRFSGADGSGSATFVAHASRFLVYRGVRANRRIRAYNSGFDLSVLQRVSDVLRDTDQNWRSSVIALQDMSQAVFKIKNLVDIIANGRKDELLARMEITDMARSVARAVVVDADTEDFTQVGSANLGAVAGLLDKSFQRLASAARMPATRLLGMSPAGMNATGASDTRAWYDQVAAEQEQELRPNALRLARLMARAFAPSVDAEALEVEFPPLWQPTELETAQHRLTVAQADAVYMTAGVVTPEEVAFSRWGSGEYSAEMDIDLEGREAEMGALKVAAEITDPVGDFPMPEGFERPAPETPPQAPEEGDG